MSDWRRVVILPGIFTVGILIAFALFSSTARSQDSAAARGKAVYDYWCEPCHAAGPGHPGTQSLEFKYQDTLPDVLTEREDLAPVFVRTIVRQGILMMAPFRKTEITDAELEDIVAYLTE